jgi:predicted DNA-binding protein
MTMKIRVFHTSINLLIEPITYQRLKMCAKLKKIPMSKIIREGINLILDKIDDENNAVMKGDKL